MFGQYSERGGREWREAAEAINANADSGGRIRRTFNDPGAVAHRWAHQSQDSAKFRDNFYFERRKLFSYGTHFLVGFIMPDGANSRDVALLNSDSYSVTTSRHQREASVAVRHMAQYALPSLTDLRDVLDSLADVSLRNVNARLSGSRDFRKLAETDISDMDDSRYSERMRIVRAANVRLRVREWLANNAEAIGTAGARYAGAVWLAELAGYTEAEAARMIAKAIRDADAAKERRAKAAELRELAEAKRIASLSAAAFRESWPRDGSDARDDSYNAKEHKQFATRLFRLAKLAKAKGWTRIAAELKAREKEFRAHSAGRSGRIVQAYRDAKAREVRAWRNGTGARPMPYLFERFPAIKAALERSQAREWAERHAAEFAAWQAGEGKRPSATSHEKDSPEFAAIAASIAADREAFRVAYDAWQAGEGERPAALASDAMPRYGDSDYRYFSDASAAIRADVERERAEAEAERQRAAERERFERAAEFRRAWLAGEASSAYSPHGRLSDDRGGALIRAVDVKRDASGAVTGGTLETSHGADVPLVHAVKAFRFVKMVRERGETWRRNGRVIRVGVYQIDAIDSDGFTAGCHRINWSEIERLARELGVYDATPSAEAVESSH